MCLGDTISLQVLSDSSVQWQHISGNTLSQANFSCTGCNNPMISPSINSVFRVIGSPSSQCGGADTVSVFVDSLKPISIQPIRDTVCKNDTLVFSIDNPDSAQVIWNNGTSGNVMFMQAVNQGINPVFTTAEKGSCTAADTAFGFASPGIPVDLGDLPYDSLLCLGQSTHIEAHSGSGPYSYNWTPGQLSSKVSASFSPIFPTDSAIVRITDTIGICSDSAKFVVHVSDLLSVSTELKDTMVCRGETVISSFFVDGGIEPYRFEINNVQSPDSVSIYAVSDTLLNISVTDSFGCTAHADDIEIKAIDTVRLTVSDDTVYTRDSVLLCMKTIGGLPPFQFDWNVSALDDSCHLVKPGTGNTLQVIMTVWGGCGSDRDTVTVINTESLGIEDVKTEFSGKIYPNPAVNYLIVESDKPANAVLMTVAGNPILTSPVSKQARIDLTALSAGIYILKIETESNRFFKSVIVQR